MRYSAFVDSGVLIGALHARDAFHARALPILKAADEGRIAPLLFTDFILAETINFLNRKGGTAAGREALQRLESSRGLRIERVSDSAYARGKNDIYGSVEGLSLVDALTVAVMLERGIHRIYSFDTDFDRVRKIRRLVALPR